MATKRIITTTPRDLLKEPFRARPTLRVAAVVGPVIIGEGQLAGTPTVAVRLGESYGSVPSRDVDPIDLLQEVEALVLGLAPGEEADPEVRVQQVVISLLPNRREDDPADQPCHPFVFGATLRGHRIAVTTSAREHAPKWLERCHFVTIRPAVPTVEDPWTHDRAETLAKAVHHCAGKVNVAFHMTCADDEGYAFAKSIAAALPRIPMYLGVGDGPDTCDGEFGVPYTTDETRERYTRLVERVLAERWMHVRVLSPLTCMAFVQ